MKSHVMSYVCVKDITAVIRQMGACMDWVNTRCPPSIPITIYYPTCILVL